MRERYLEVGSELSLKEGGKQWLGWKRHQGLGKAFLSHERAVNILCVRQWGGGGDRLVDVFLVSSKCTVEPEKQNLGCKK